MDPANWPDPPIVTHFLLENPWPAAIILIGLGLAMAMSALRNERPRLLKWAGGSLALGVVVIILSMLVTTQREHIRRGTEQMFDAALPELSTPRLKTFLTDDMRLTIANAGINRSRDEVLETAELAMRIYTIADHRRPSIKTESTGDGTGRSYASVMVQIDHAMGRYPTQVRFIMHWRREADGAWRVDRIPWVQVNGTEVNDAMLP